MVFGYFLMPCVFCVLITMIASGYLVIDICFKVSRGDRWGAGAEVGSVEGWILFWFGGGACFVFWRGVGLMGGGAPVPSMAILGWAAVLLSRWQTCLR